MQVCFDMAAIVLNDDTRQKLNDELRHSSSRFRVVFLDDSRLDLFDALPGDASLTIISEILES